ncbi:MAG: hypothetical protein L0Y72_27000 [Gemmataceae bacterium]|nr:hypothetical protein [Gemmataceae bacterium]MCI0742699.1 hypothetical protein [Gemmataceae bacterium]
MRRLQTLSLIIVLVAPGLATAQSAQKPPVPLVRTEQTPGYQPMLIEGFTVVISKECLKHKDDEMYERKPLDVLEGELKTIVKLMPEKTVNVLRNILIWVEWNESVDLGNGRPGTATAVYYGGHQRSMLAKGMHPFQAGSVTIHKLKALTEEHQPKRDSGRCVILHEIAHAVHYQLVGRDYLPVKLAYKQAMERKLLEPNSYAATNESEYFAEMTCAYFDQLNYYPRTRSDLKKHDTVTFKLMEATWGKTKLDSKVASAKSVEAPPLDKLDLGAPLLGPRVTAETLKGRPAFVIYWNGIDVTSQSSLTKISAWDAELADFGLVTLAVHLSGAKKFDVKNFVEARGLSFSIAEGPWRMSGIIKTYKDFPLALVYEADGDCVFRGLPFDAESALRSAVGAALVKELSDGEAPKALVPVVEALAKGKSPSTQFAKIVTLTRSKGEETAQAAQKLLAKMTEAGQRALESAEPKVKDDPVAAFLALERLPAAFKDTPVATKAAKLLAGLKQNKEVAPELKARALLAVVKKLETDLSGRPGSFDPTQPKFRKDNALALLQLEQAVQQMRRTWPSARATEQAIRVADKFGVK